MTESFQLTITGASGSVPARHWFVALPIASREAADRWTWASPRFRPGGVLHRPVQRRVDDEHGVSPFDSRGPLSGVSADDLLAEQP